MARKTDTKTPKSRPPLSDEQKQKERKRFEVIGEAMKESFSVYQANPNEEWEKKKKRLDAIAPLPPRKPSTSER